MSIRTVDVPGISCEHCVKTIEREVGELAGVANVRADLADRKVTVEWDESTVDWSAIRAVMEEANYPPED